MQTVFNNRAVVRLWLGQAQDHARNREASLSFHGDRLFSDSTLIARRYRNERGMQLILIAHLPAGSAAARHVALLLAEIGRARLAGAIQVPDLNATAVGAHAENLIYLMRRHHLLQERIESTKSPRILLRYAPLAAAAQADIDTYTSFFDLRPKGKQ